MFRVRRVTTLFFLQLLLQRCGALDACEADFCGEDATHLLQANHKRRLKKASAGDGSSLHAQASKTGASLRFIITADGTTFARGTAVSKTWGKDLQQLVYIVGEDANISSHQQVMHVPNVADVYYPPTEKNLLGLQEVYSRFPNDDWYLRCDDDSYVDVRGMIAFLEIFDSKSPTYLGSYCAGREWERDVMGIPADMHGYAEGGFCEIMSNSAVRALLPHLASCLADSYKIPPYNRHSDAELGKCLFRAGVRLTTVAGNASAPIFAKLSLGKETAPMAEPDLENLLANRSRLLESVVAHPLKQEGHMALVHDLHASSANKLSGVPIYWIGQSSNLPRFSHTATALRMLTANPSLVTHVEAVNKETFLQAANFTPLEMNYGVKVTDPAAFRIDADCVGDCFLKVFAVSLSHLKAIHSAYADNQPYALILEDDVDLAAVLSWKTSLAKYVQSLEDRWDVVQLLVHASEFVWSWMRDTWQDSNHPPTIPIGRNQARSVLSTGAYLISRSGMKKFVDAFPMQDGIIQVSKSCVTESGLLEFSADVCLLSGEVFPEDGLTSFAKSVATPPLLGDSVHFKDGVHGETDFHVTSRRLWREWLEEASPVS